VIELFQDGGFFPVDLGALRDGRMQQFQAPLAGHDLIRLP
jgi:predicted dinucleotide-binding enzyme